MKSFETNRIMSMVNDENIPEEKKLEIFNSSFNNLTKISIDLLADSINKIVTPSGEVTEKQYITEFVNNVDKDVFEKIQNHIKELKQHNDIKPLEFSSTPEQIELGAPETYTIPITFNNSDFFAQGF